jgi:hypothetical protein
VERKGSHILVAVDNVVILTRAKVDKTTLLAGDKDFISAARIVFGVAFVLSLEQLLQIKSIGDQNIISLGR